jgi:ABC-type transporter MlaC component
MNRGAEKAMTEAKPIFVNAIKAMTIRDAINIVTGGEGAATNYLKRTTSAQLQEKFYPVIQKSLDAVGANEPWTKVSSAYNMVMGTNVTTDLNQYVTDNAMTALFTEIKKEEDKIREDPLARITPILKKVFGYADSKKQ